MDVKNQELAIEPVKFPRSEKIEKGSDGWLSPLGSYYKVETTQHDESATYLVENSVEAKGEEKRRFRYPHDREEYDDKPSREKLKELGWILVRGDILRSEDALNFTGPQLQAISEAGIKVISAFDGSTEYSSSEIQALIGKINSGFAKSGVIQQVRDDLENGKYSPWFITTREETIRRIDDFGRNPFRKSIMTDELHAYEPELLPTEIFDVMSNGFSEEMKMHLGRSEYTFRLLDLKTGAKVWIEREEYFHDGLSGGMMGDRNNYISMYVVDDVLMRERLTRLIKNRTFDKPPEIKFQTKDGYFEKFFSGIIKT